MYGGRRNTARRARAPRRLRRPRDATRSPHVGVARAARAGAQRVKRQPGGQPGGDRRIGARIHLAKRAIVGRPLASGRVSSTLLPKRLALPIFASDALSSVAYATEAALAVLVAASLSGRRLLIPISLAIAALLVLVVLSYRQTVRAYPGGGGSYIVASQNLGRVPGLVAAASLLVDYVLTVAVSIAAGVLAITSAVPALSGRRVELSLVFLVVLAVANGRGVREAGRLFAIPTYGFVVAAFAMIAVGLGKQGRGRLPAGKRRTPRRRAPRPACPPSSCCAHSRPGAAPDRGGSDRQRRPGLAATGTQRRGDPRDPGRDRSCSSGRRCSPSRPAHGPAARCRSCRRWRAPCSRRGRRRRPGSSPCRASPLPSSCSPPTPPSRAFRD